VTDTESAVSNLGLTAFVKHLVKLVKQSTLREGEKKRIKGTEISKVNRLNRFCSLPSGKRKKKVKRIETSWSSFLSLTTAKVFRCSLLFPKKM
jgi:hypothetical protein